MKRDDSVYLWHILDAIARIEEYLEGVSPETFKARTQIQDAVIRQIEIIGEAADICRASCVTGIPVFPGKTLSGCAIS